MQGRCLAGLADLSDFGRTTGAFEAERHADLRFGDIEAFGPSPELQAHQLTGAQFDWSDDGPNLSGRGDEAKSSGHALGLVLRMRGEVESILGVGRREIVAMRNGGVGLLRDTVSQPAVRDISLGPSFERSRIAFDKITL